MIRRSFLKLIAASPLLGLLKKKTRSGIRKCTPEETKDFYSYMEEIHPTTGTSGGHCWIEAINCEPETWHWDSAKQSVLNVDADSQHIGNRILLNTGQVYECWPRRGQL